MASLRPFLSLLLLSLTVSSCGLVRAPFRVAGGLANGAYKGGKKVSDAMAERKLRKEQEKEQLAKEEARKEGKAKAEQTGAIVPGPTAPPAEGPIIPLDESKIPVPTAPEPALPQ
jgi:hypothetical protein